MAQQIVIEVPGTKISELEKTSSVSRGDVAPVVQGDETKQADIGQIADFVKSELGSAAIKDESDFATPAAVAEVNQSSQMRDDAQNERIDNVEHGLVSIGGGADASFSTYAEMIAYVPLKLMFQSVIMIQTLNYVVYIRGQVLNMWRVMILLLPQ